MNNIDLFRIHKRIAAFTVSLSLAVSLISVPLYSKAEEVQEDYQADTGIVDVQSVEVSRFAVLKGQLNQLVDQEEDGTVNTTVAERDWKQYSTSYVYEHMNSKEQELYDALDSVCLQFIQDSSEDALHLTDITGNSGEYLSAVHIDKSLIDFWHPCNSKYIDVVQLFIYANPQYYFTTSAYAKSGNNLYLYCYPAFADGDDRAVTTNELFSKIDSWVEDINKDNTTRETIEKYTHDFLCDTLSYDHDSADKMAVKDYSGDVYYSQSIYSAIDKNKTVCAGYSLTFELLMNALGVPTVTAYSDYHAWNKVNLNDDKWYAVDVTWDDQDELSKIDYTFYNKSDESIKVSDDLDPVHVAKTSEYYPKAESDYVEEKQIESTLNNKEVSEDEAATGNTEESGDVKDTDAEEVIDDSDNTTDSNDNDAEDVFDANDKELIDEVNKADDSKADNAGAAAEVSINENDKNNDIDNTDNTANIANDIKDTTEATTEIPVSTEVVVERDADSKYNADNQDKIETINSPKITKIKSYSKKIKISWNKVDDISGYELQISTTKNFKKNVKTVRTSASSSGAWIKKLKKHTKYYVRIRSYKNHNQDKILSDWSGVKKVTTK